MSRGGEQKNSQVKPHNYSKVEADICTSNTVIQTHCYQQKYYCIIECGLNTSFDSIKSFLYFQV